MAHAGSRRRLALVALGALALGLLANCKGPRVKLPVRDTDDDNDEQVIACSDIEPCEHAELKVCGARGICVECREASDCEPGEICALDGECDRLGAD